MDNIVSISAKGRATSPYDFATFQATIRGVGSTGPEAKEQTRAVSHHLFDALKALRDRGIEFRDKELRTSFDVQQHHVYNPEKRANEFRGYCATFTATVTTDSIDKVGEIHDALTSVFGVEVSSPQLQLLPERREELKHEAFAAAVKAVRSKLYAQCEALELDSDNFKMLCWEENDHRNSFGAAGGGKFAALAECANEAAGGPLEFHAGVATVTADITLHFSPTAG